MKFNRGVRRTKTPATNAKKVFTNRLNTTTQKMRVPKSKTVVRSSDATLIAAALL